jgi:predicted transcriptional regulator
MNKQGISISAMARYLGVARTTAYAYYHRTMTPSLLQALKIRELCGGEVKLTSLVAVDKSEGIDDL